MSKPTLSEAIAVLRALAGKMRDGSPCWCLAQHDEDMGGDDEPEGRYGEIHEDACEAARDLLARHGHYVPRSPTPREKE